MFRPTVLDVYQLSNTQLGACFSVYGIVALISYLAGGGLADKYSPRLLMSVSLLLTALGGFYMASYPSFNGLCVLYGYWGFTTIFLFWAAMIKATRLWGGNDKQGIAFGVLDAGRGFVSYLFGAVGVLIFGWFLNDNLEQIALTTKQQSYSYVIYACSLIIIATAVLVFLFLKSAEDSVTSTSTNPAQVNVWSNYRKVIKIPSVGLLMIIILCAYTGYKITDIFSQFAHEIMGYNQEEAAEIGRDFLGIRIFIGVIIGWLADKSSASYMMIIGFITALLGAVLFASGWVDNPNFLLFWVAIIMTATGVYALRALYFAAVQEGNIPIALTGTAVGIISLVGYTPDVFMGPAIGYFLDGWPGKIGFQYVFVMLTVFSIIGLAASIRFKIIHRK